MITKNTFEFTGTVTKAKGLLKKKFIGKCLNVIVTVTGKKDEFTSPINRVFKTGIRITKAPLVGSFLSRYNLLADYPYVLMNLQVSHEIKFSFGKVGISLNVIPWTKLDSVKIIGSLKHKILGFIIDAIQVEGNAILVSSEDITEPAKKR